MNIINYIEKGNGLHDALAAHGFFLSQEYGQGEPQWVLYRKDNLMATEADYAAAQAIIDGYDQAGALRAKAILSVKAAAQDLIYAIAPAWKQNNLIARSVDLVNKIVMFGGLDESEQAEVDLAETVFAKIKAIRSCSDRIEAWLAGVTDAATLATFDALNPPSQLAWPE